ncbi:MAG: hypothetical protein ACI4TM_01935 [Candidatus Cryptobacteroides sp.]
MDMFGIVIMCIMLHTLAGAGVHSEDSLLVMFWNMENFYDWKDSGQGRSDAEFSSSGARRWTSGRFHAKCDAAAKAIFLIGDRYGRMPDAIGLCEIENRGVLYRLLDDTLLRKYGYRIVHYDSGDRRGIDVALLYRDSSFRFVSCHRKVPEYEGRRMDTRDILQVCLQEREYGGYIHFIVNHHPSKFGGAKESQGRRVAVMEALKSVCDSLDEVSGGVPIVAMGDFNDIPSAEQFSVMDGVLENKSEPLSRQGKGTIRFQGKWDLIDMFLVSRDIADRSRMYIEHIPFLMVWDSAYPGFKPFRTYSGPRYLGGVSDHCPIVLKIKREKKI